MSTAAARSREERRRLRGAMMRRLVLTPVRRWTANRKLHLCMAIRGGVITQAEAIAAHKLSVDELVAWLNAVERRDFEALRARQRRAA
jgi:hypothetical protein